MLRYLVILVTFSFIYSEAVLQNPINSLKDTENQQKRTQISHNYQDSIRTRYYPAQTTRENSNTKQNAYLQINHFYNSQNNAFAALSSYNSQSLIQPHLHPNKQQSIAAQCTTIYLSDLDACIPVHCPPNYQWNITSRQCELPPPKCKSYYVWNGSVCLPTPTTFPHILQISRYFENNRYKCANNQTNCQKKICPQGFTWIQNSCLPISSQQKCPTSNIVNGICQPSYSLQISIKPTCIEGESRWNGLECIRMQPLSVPLLAQPARVANTPILSSMNSHSNLFNPSLFFSNSQALNPLLGTSDYLNNFFLRSSNLFIPQMQSKIPILIPSFSSNYVNQPPMNIDLTIPGIVTPKIITPPSPSYVPEAKPRYIT